MTFFQFPESGFHIVKNNHNDYDFSFKKQSLLFITSKTHSNNDFLIY